MWDAVSSRKHSILKVFPFGPMSSEVMLYGTVAYVLKDGRRFEVPWGARAMMVKDREAWKMGFYQVYLVSATIPW
jgi:hypothetical protein